MTFTHNLAQPNLIIEVWDETSTPILVGVDIIRVDINNAKIQITSSPDARFAGRIVIDR